MLPDRVSNPGPLTYESGALPIALRGPAPNTKKHFNIVCLILLFSIRKQFDQPSGLIKLCIICQLGCF